MQVGDCYFWSGDDTIEAFPDVACTEGSHVGAFSATTKNTYRIYNHKAILIATDDAFSNQPNELYDTLWQVEGVYPVWYDYQSFILPACLFVLCFFFCIYKWFIRLRG